MDWKFSANVSFFGARRDRFTQYQPARTLVEKLDLVSEIEGISGVELKYPRDFGDVAQVKRLLQAHHLILSAVNVDIKDAAFFRHGALSARSQAARQKAVSLLREGMDVAAEMDCALATTCPLAEGYDYAFQIDYTAAWGHLIESVRSVVTHRDDVRLCLEYQPHEPHARIMLDNAGKLLYVCSEVGAANLGANLDVGHAFAAGESPAEAAVLLAAKGRLFYVHSNDNTGEGGDWDMISGTVHFWHWLELLYTLDRLGYDGWFSGDLAPKHFGPVAAYRTNMHMIQRMSALIDRAGTDAIAKLLAQDGTVAEIYEHLSSFLGS